MKKLTKNEIQKEYEVVTQNIVDKGFVIKFVDDTDENVTGRLSTMFEDNSHEYLVLLEKLEDDGVIKFMFNGEKIGEYVEDENGLFTAFE